MATLNVDDSAHQVLKWAREQVRKTGESGADLSDGIRWMKDEIEWNKVKKE